MSFQVSSIQNTEEGKVVSCRPLVSWRVIVEKHAVRVILYSAGSFNGSFKSISNISVVACDSLNQFFMVPVF